MSAAAYLFAGVWFIGFIAAAASMLKAQHHGTRAAQHLPEASRKIYLMDLCLFPFAAWTADRPNGQGLIHHATAIKKRKARHDRNPFPIRAHLHHDRLRRHDQRHNLDQPGEDIA